MELSNYTKEEIEKEIENSVNAFSELEGIDVKRMENQIFYVKEIMEHYRNDYKNVIVSAPTGFGKSIVAFLLADVFKRLEGNTYIMTSNKYLQNQYNEDVKKFNFEDTVMLKGQSNYICDENGKPITKRQCSDYSFKKVENLDTPFECAKDCFFIQQRKKAHTLPKTILNYSYFLSSMNKVYKKLGEFAPFQPRDLNIFDECHVMGDIVQDSFSLDINLSSLVRRTSTYISILENKIINCEKQYYKNLSNYKKFYNLVVKCGKENGDYEKQHKILGDIIDEIEKIKNDYKNLIKDFTKKYKNESGTLKNLSKEDQTLVTHLKTLINLHKELINLYEFYERIGFDSMVVYLEYPKDEKLKPIRELDNKNRTLKLKCTDESELVKSKVHEFTNYSLFMSATVGRIEDWAKQIGLENGEYKGIEVPQVFDYEKSPIKKVSPMISMSYKDKKENMPKMLERIEEIIENHPNERGMVHTGNYQLTKEIENLGNPRIITYLNSKEKDEAVKNYKNSKNSVICAPSLVEGVDFKDDLCRFMAFAKVPYLSLGDQLTKRKMKRYKNWYEWATASNIMQGLGRSVRNKNDWCITYFLDASFESFIKRYSLPDWVMDRIETVKSGELNKEYDPDKEFDKELENMF